MRLDGQTLIYESTEPDGERSRSYFHIRRAPGAAPSEVKLCGPGLSDEQKRSALVAQLKVFLDGRTAEQAVAQRERFPGAGPCLTWQQVANPSPTEMGKVEERNWDRLPDEFRRSVLPELQTYNMPPRGAIGCGLPV